jgi:hypothetical protein
MPIFFPDNEHRQSRLIELGTDTQTFLFDATNGYAQFKTLLDQVNGQIADAYKEAKLQPPAVSSHDVLKIAGVTDAISNADTIVKISEVIADVGGFIGTVKYLAPAATRLLVRTGAMSAETAAKVFTRFTVPLIEREVVLTAGDLAGGVLSGVLGGVVIAGIDLGIDAIEGSIARDKLRVGIHTVYPLRQTTRMSLDQTSVLLQSLQAVKATLDAITGVGLPLTDQLLRNLITKDVQPAVNAEKTITLATVNSELANLDGARSSWTNEDSPQAATV